MSHEIYFIGLQSSASSLPPVSTVESGMRGGHTNHVPTHRSSSRAFYLCWEGRRIAQSVSLSDCCTCKQDTSRMEGTDVSHSPDIAECFPLPVDLIRIPSSRTLLVARHVVHVFVPCKVGKVPCRTTFTLRRRANPET